MTGSMTADLILMKRKVSMPTMMILSLFSLSKQSPPPPPPCLGLKTHVFKGTKKNKIKLKGKSQAAKKVVLGAIVRDFSIFCET